MEVKQVLQQQHHLVPHRRIIVGKQFRDLRQELGNQPWYKVVVQLAYKGDTPVSRGACNSRQALLDLSCFMSNPDIFANAGGVIVFYFEWLKNLSHVLFGRLEKRYQESAHSRMLSTIETATGTRLTPEERASVIRGSDELVVVNSGLEEIMVVAYHEICDTLRRHPVADHLIIPCCTE